MMASGGGTGSNGSRSPQRLFRRFAPNDDIEDGPADRLLPGQELWLDEYLVDPSYRYCVVMQSDGNVVLYNYDAPNRRCFVLPVHWSTQTNWAGCCYRFTMQGDGNLVVQLANNPPIWVKPGATRVPGSYLRLQCDRNLVLYTPTGGVTWTSGTSTGGC